MYEPKESLPLIVKLDRAVSRALVIGGHVPNADLTSNLQTLQAFLSSLPGSLDNYARDGIRGTLWVSSDMGYLIRDTLESGKMMSPPTLPYSPLWGMLNHIWDWDRTPGMVELGTLAGYRLVTGDADIVSAHTVMVAVPNEIDYSVIRQFVEGILELQSSPLIALTSNKPFTDSNVYAHAYGVDAPSSAWGLSITGALEDSPVALSRNPEGTGYFTLYAHPLSPVTLHFGTTLKEGVYTLGFLTGATQTNSDNLYLRIHDTNGAGNLLGLNVAFDGITAESFNGPTPDSVPVVDFDEDEFVGIVATLNVSAASCTASLNVVNSMSYSVGPSLSFLGTLEASVALEYAKPIGNVTSTKLKALVVWPGVVSLGRAATLLRRLL